MSTGADCHFDEVEPGRWTYPPGRHPIGCPHTAEERSAEEQAECGAIYTTTTLYGGGQDICRRTAGHNGGHDWRGERA